MHLQQGVQSPPPPPPQLLPQEEPDELEPESEEEPQLELESEEEPQLDDPEDVDELHDDPPPEDSTSIAGTSMLNPPSVLAAKLRSRSKETSESPIEKFRFEKSPVRPKPPLAFW